MSVRNREYARKQSHTPASIRTPTPIQFVQKSIKLVTRQYLAPTVISTVLLVLYFTGNICQSPNSIIRRVFGEEEHHGMTIVADEIWQHVGDEIELGVSLETRLQDWADAPLFDIEPADWVERGMKTCPATRIVPNQNLAVMTESHYLWSSMSTRKIGLLRHDMIAFLRQADADGKMSKPHWGTGKGLVFTAGNADTFKRVLTTLKLLNNHFNTHLPAEIFSFPGEVPTAAVRKELEHYGAKLKVVENAVKDGEKTKSYHIKATAIIRSSFREVLYLDSDNLPAAGLSPVDTKAKAHKFDQKTLSQTAGLWEAKAYKRLGVMFWQDYWRTGADNPIWAIIGVACRDEWEQESGQILIDKSLHLDALLLSEWMMESSRFKFWMHFSDGDKDLFRYAFLALRKRWGVPGRYVGVGGFPYNTKSGFGGHTMLQHDHVGKPLFVHANLLKQIASGIGPGYAWGRTKSMGLPTNAKLLPSESPFESELEEHLVDYDVDCDQLANSDAEGNSIKPAVLAVRRRAALERGMAATWHGGAKSDPLCIDMSYKDTRDEHDVDHQRSLLPHDHHLYSHSSADSHKSGLLTVEVDLRELNVTKTAEGTELYWGLDALSVKNWNDDLRLRDFERIFFEEGGHLNNPGFYDPNGEFVEHPEDHELNQGSHFEEEEEDEEEDNFHHLSQESHLHEAESNHHHNSHHEESTNGHIHHHHQQIIEEKNNDQQFHQNIHHHQDLESNGHHNHHEFHDHESHFENEHPHQNNHHNIENSDHIDQKNHHFQEDHDFERERLHQEHIEHEIQYHEEQYRQQQEQLHQQAAHEENYHNYHKERYPELHHQSGHSEPLESHPDHYPSNHNQEYEHENVHHHHHQGEGERERESHSEQYYSENDNVQHFEEGHHGQIHHEEIHHHHDSHHNQYHD